jgi:hypothetical protein
MPCALKQKGNSGKGYMFLTIICFLSGNKTVGFISFWPIGNAILMHMGTSTSQYEILVCEEFINMGTVYTGIQY